ncbi:unnamed protein product [Blepharisma stoltei]|uniref:Protein kinase domain-containing protein n=1 Tax=Blepharisma stoltei TaxID=1481888 RepID=A0AAU9JRC4_9CILI|nr:unnamed protein product [Blepharisma stoltei]
MNTIFEIADHQAQGIWKFWMPYDHIDSCEIFRGKLYEMSKQKILKEGEYTLTPKFLINLSSSPKKMVPIEWKILEPFVEHDETGNHYGFRLGHNQHSRDFYVSDVKFLDSWIEKLSSLCIKTDIEDDYEFIKLIGTGKFAQVFLAESNEDFERYAVKAIKKDRLLKDSELLNSLTNEIKIMRKCIHPNIVKLHRVYESNTHVYLVEDFVRGGCMFTRIIKKKRFTMETIVKLSHRLMGVLEYLDSLNIVHRDIKLENILMVSEHNDYEFKLADFGLAEEATGDLFKKCGSPGYIAPEVINGLPYGTKADLFSTGIVLYILISGKMPFFGKTAQDILVKNKECKLNFEEQIWREVSMNCLAFVTKILNKDPCRRGYARDLLKHPFFNESRVVIDDVKKLHKSETKVAEERIIIHRKLSKL